jgi:hypothetical protein
MNRPRERRTALGFGYVRLTGRGGHTMQHVLLRRVRLGMLAVCGPVYVVGMHIEQHDQPIRELELVPAEQAEGLTAFDWFHVLPRGWPLDAGPSALEVPAGAALVLRVADTSSMLERFPWALSLHRPWIVPRECHCTAVCQAVLA